MVSWNIQYCNFGYYRFNKKAIRKRVWRLPGPPNPHPSWQSSTMPFLKRGIICKPFFRCFGTVMSWYSSFSVLRGGWVWNFTVDCFPVLYGTISCSILLWAQSSSVLEDLIGYPGKMFTNGSTLGQIIGGEAGGCIRFS